MNREKAYSKKIISSILSNGISTDAELHRKKFEFAKGLGFSSLPTNPTILSYAKEKTPKLKKLLGIKPVRTLSGVAVVAIMSKPHKCPGKCIYCPSAESFGKKAPKSYTGFEPAAMRAELNDFDSYKQVKNRLSQLEATAHNTGKIELILMGGTLPSCSLSYQHSFVKGALDAISGKSSNSLQAAIKNCETSKRRLTGLTFETRPDYCKEKHINRMLSMGCTRVELGVQATDDSVYKKIHRGHTVKDVAIATQLLKDSALKVCYHIMPGLPYSNPKKDLRAFRELFSNSDFKPDMLKIYPCLVTKGTELHRLWEKGKYEPLSTPQAAEFIAEAKRFVPKYCRIMRIQRDIPLGQISAGVGNSNLRQYVENEMKKKRINCNCIRCREAGLKKFLHGKEPDLGKVKILTQTYNANKGTEIFISAEDTKNDILIGFCRLRIPYKPFRKELKDAALLRELHVFGSPASLGEKPEEAYQHKGFGKQLLEEAEFIASGRMDAPKLAVISGIGVRQYYASLGYKLMAPYMVKQII